MKSKTCKNCQKEYNKANHKFCSRTCEANWKKGKTWDEIFGNKADNMRQLRRGKRVSKGTEFKKNWQYSGEGKTILRNRIGNICKKPTLSESLMAELIEQNDLPFKFVGDGGLLIGSKTPDFVYTGEGNKLLEVYSEYHHSPSVCGYWHQTEQGAKDYYALFGYNVLIIWNNEIKKHPGLVLNKVLEFMDTTMEIPNLGEKYQRMFDELVKREFDGDSGRALSSLIDYYYLLGPMIARMDNFEVRILKIEGSKQQSEEKKTKLMSGELLK